MRTRIHSSLKFKHTLLAIWVSLVSALACAAQPVTQISAGGWHNLFLKADGSLWGMGNRFEGQLGDGSFDFGLNQPLQIVSSNVISIGAARHHSLFVKADGSLWATGDNLNGQLGNGFY